MEGLSAATTCLSKAERALWASEWHRRPRVQVEIAVDIAEGADFAPIPGDELIQRPVYVYSREAIDENCARYSRFKDDVTPEKVEARRTRMHGEFEADESAIANAPETILYEQAEAEHDRLSAAHVDVCRSIMDVHPTTIPGLLEMLDPIGDLGDSFADEADEVMEHICALAHAVLGGSPT